MDDTFSKYVELIKAIAWPIVVLLLVVVFWRPLHQMADEAPALLRSSDSITIAGLSIRVGTHIEDPSPDVQAALNKMSQEEMVELLSINPRQMVFNVIHPKDQTVTPGDIFQPIDVKLLNQGMLAIDRHAVEGRPDLIEYSTRVTDKGLSTQKYLQDVTQVLFAQILQKK